MTGARVGSEEDDQMERETDYCRRKAAEYERRAQEAADKDIRTFLCRMRDNWVEAAKDFERVGKTHHRQAATDVARPLAMR
jgi:hypothetical protein